MVADTDPRVEFILRTKSDVTDMPRSYRIDPSFWASVKSDPNDAQNIAERIIASYGLNIYDGACFQMAAALGGHPERARDQTMRLLSGVAGSVDIAANVFPFSYGEKKWTGPEPSYYMRTITDQFIRRDPLTGSPVEWMDWKPITGENAWANLIGPLQSLYVTKGAAISYDEPEIQLAINHLPVFKAMQSHLGGLYYSANDGDALCTEISVENNASSLAGLRLLKEILLMINGHQDKIVLIDEITNGIVEFLKKVAYDHDSSIFHQGGVVYGDSLLPSNDFAVDCQTWVLTVLGQHDVDSWFGPGTALKIWENTKKRAGVFGKSGKLLGVGYTDGHKVMSSEWTFGAINMCRVLSAQYSSVDPAASASLKADANSMMAGVQALRVTLPDQTVGYKYASERYWIPFGWWANPVPSMTATAWSIMLDHGFNPFSLNEQILPKATYILPASSQLVQ